MGKGGKAPTKFFETANVDSDIRNEAAWQARPELEAKWKARQASEKKTLALKHDADLKGVKAASVTKLDTDHTDEEAWQARKKLKARSKAKKKAEAEALAAANAKFFNSVKTTTRSDEIDDNLMDEEEWQTRPELEEQAQHLRNREAADLRLKNGAIGERLMNVRPKVVVTSPFGLAEWEKPNYVDAVQFDPASVEGTAENWLPRNRDKYVARLNWSTVAPTNIRERPPTWLRSWEKYDWGELRGPPQARATTGMNFGIAANGQATAMRLEKRRQMIASGQISDAENGLASKAGISYSKY